MRAQRAGAGNPVNKPLTPVEGLIPPTRRIMGEVPHVTCPVGALEGKNLAAAFKNSAAESAGIKPARDVGNKSRRPLGRNL